MSDLLQGVLVFAVVIPAIVFHEVAHGYVAFLLGDPTAKDMGRLSLNPVKHVDPFGTLLLPAMLTFLGGPVFGYAKPVPINPRYFRNFRVGMLLTGLAGPATNFALAVLAALVVRLVPVEASPGAGPVGAAMFILALFCEINLVLMFFNLIPIPPFDGSRVIPIFLSDKALRVYAQVERYGFIIIFGLLFFFRGAVSTYFAYTVDPVARLLLGF